MVSLISAQPSTFRTAGVARLRRGSLASTPQVNMLDLGGAAGAKQVEAVVAVDAVADAPVTRGDLTRLYREHYTPLVRMASMLLDDVAQAEEVVQDAFVRMFELRNPPPRGKAPAYLRSAVLNGARSYIRKLVVRRKHQPDRPGVVGAAEIDGLAGVFSDEVIKTVRALPRRQSEVLLLRYYLDLSEAEIAETLGISAGSVKTHASRGLARLSEVLEDPS